MDNKITITLEEYKNLKTIEAKALIIAKMVESNKYVSTGDLKIILDIKDAEEQGEADGCA